MLYQINDITLQLDFNDGILLAASGPDSLYYVELLEYKKNSSSPVSLETFSIFPNTKMKYETHLFFCGIKFYVDFEIIVYKFVLNEGLVKIFNHRYNDYGKVIKFVINTDDGEEASLWLTEIEKYCKIHSCKKIIESKFDDVNKSSSLYFYNKEIAPYRTYYIGRYPKISEDWKTYDPRKEDLLWFSNWKTIWSYEHPRSWINLSSQEIVQDILGF